MRLELGAGGTCRPEHPLNTEAGRKELSQNGGTGCIRGEIGKEVRRLPVGYPREDELVEVPHDRLEILSCFGRLFRQGGPQLSRFGAGEYRKGLDPFLVIGDPVYNGMTPEPELFRGHVKIFMVFHGINRRPLWSSRPPIPCPPGRGRASGSSCPVSSLKAQPPCPHSLSRAGMPVSV